MLKKRINKITKTLEANPKIIAAWLFGSAHTNRMTKNSDIDIAVLFSDKPDFDFKMELLTELQNAADFEKIDLVTLNDASPVLQFEAVSGQLLFTKNKNRCVEFISLVAREYEDEMAFAQKYLNIPINKKC